jgi:uncharacterized membrane protein YraQ (UPF0718 family)/copper chaperone CopZ
LIDILLEIASKSWLVLGQMAPYLLFGFLMAGVLSVCISPAWVERHLGKAGPGPVLKAALFGVPLPLCSCSVIPVSASMYRHGASRPATTAFLLSTPQTGVDSIAVTYALLGPVFAVFRPIAALATGLAGGYLTQLFDRTGRGDVAEESKPPACADDCCAPAAPRNVVLRMLRYGFVTLPRDIGPALLLGCLVAGAMAAFVKPGQWEAYLGGGFASILLMMAAGVPIYVCATASVPLAAAFIHAGGSPGGALAFLIAGPATNAATFTTIWKLLGRRSAMLYIATVALSAIACGLLLNWLFPALEAEEPPLAGHNHVSWWTHAAAITLLAVLVLSLATKARRSRAEWKAAKDEARGETPGGRQRLHLRVTGMTCSHCAESVRRSIANRPGVESVEVELQGGRVTVIGDHLDSDDLVATVAELGYNANLPDG